MQVDNWLQISPYDSKSSVEKEIYAAADDELCLFSEVFKAQKEYLKADSHMWTSILTRNWLVKPKIQQRSGARGY